VLISKAEGRINQYLNYLENNAYREIAVLEFEMLEPAAGAGGRGSPPEPNKTLRSPPKEGEWKKIKAPCPWGREWNTTWFRTRYRTPASARRPLFLRVLPNADSLAFVDGKPYGAFNLYHKKLRIWGDGAEHTLHVEAYAGNFYGGSGPLEGGSILVTLGKTLPALPNTFEGGGVLERFEGIYSLFYDVKVLWETAKQLDANSLRRARITKGLYEALMGISLSAEREELEAQALKAAKKIAPLLAAKNGSTAPEIHLIGHAHIDHAWLWPIAETTHKAARTYSNMIRFMREYPEFVFIQSQPCQLEQIKNEYPAIFEAVKEAYKKGSWEPNGGMWVEADCNIPSGESLIRQFLAGKQFNRENLGCEADTLWLPDVFGYAAALPQILKGCGIKYFVTSKIGWNDTTRFPYDTFMWRGIDGSGIKTTFISAKSGGYNGRVNPGDLINAWNEVQHKEIQSALIRSIGEGDGGGGTLRSDLETARRLKNLEGAPRTGWKKVSAALDAIFKDKNTEWPEWRGELYLELHRGTYTTQSRTKRNNRRAEFALRHTEWIAALADSLPYPRDELLAVWKQVLTLQFHDIIPGSSIGRVYEEAEAAHKKLLARLAELAGERRRRILKENGADVLVFNDLSWEREAPFVFCGKEAKNAYALKDKGGALYPIQRYQDLDGKDAALCAARLPPLGWKAFTRVQGAAAAVSPFSFSPESLSTPFYNVRFDPRGRIAGLWDKEAACELVAPGGVFNAFISAEDIPVFWDAWDIDSDWTKSAKEETALISSEAVSTGPLCFRLRQTYRIGTASTLVQDVVFYSGERRIDFETKADWKEKHRLLKVSFDTAVDTSRVRCEVQYGHLFRNTHRNLPQDRAMFEICAHKWICLEDAAGGIALLNDCKYGHDVSGGRMRLSLLRSPAAPDTQADQGEHRFTYALLPFNGPFAGSRVVRTGYELNAGAAFTPAGPGEKTAAGMDYSFCSVDGEAVIIESIKAPEQDEKGLVIRLYESLGGRAAAVLRFNQPIAAVWACDMLERNRKKLRPSGKNLALEFTPFEIKTLLISF
jgi:alpha-mannosidase